jgi:hypothetical protein
LAAPLNGVASHEIAVKIPYMGFAKFRTYFVGDAAAEWTVTPSDLLFFSLFYYVEP